MPPQPQQKKSVTVSQHLDYYLPIHSTWAFKVTVHTTNPPSSFSKKLGEKESSIARALLGGHSVSIAKAVMEADEVREAIISKFLWTLNQECSKLCRKSDTPSLFRRIPVEAMKEFEWTRMSSELQSNAPLLYRLLYSIVARSDHRNVVKVGKAHFPGLCSAAAVLLKERNREMCGLQSMISLIMYSTHCEKQVIIVNSHKY